MPLVPFGKYRQNPNTPYKGTSIFRSRSYICAPQIITQKTVAI